MEINMVKPKSPQESIARKHRQKIRSFTIFTTNGMVEILISVLITADGFWYQNR